MHWFMYRTGYTFFSGHFGSSCIGSGEEKRLYLSLVRSHLSYANKVWAPQSYITV